MGAPALRDPELRLPPYLIDLVRCVYLVGSVYLVRFVPPYEQDKPTNRVRGIVSSAECGGAV